MGMEVALATLGLEVGRLTAVSSCVPPVSPSSSWPCSVPLGVGSTFYLPNPMEPSPDTVVVELDPTVRPTPPSSCGPS
jgi:hypothetical protein